MKEINKMYINQIKEELCIIMNKVWTETTDCYEPCDCICDKQRHDEKYIRVDEEVIEFIKDAVDEKINNINLNDKRDK